MDQRLTVTARAHFALALALAGPACQPGGGPPTTVTGSNSADQILFGLESRLTVDGVLRVLVHADTAYFYEGTQNAELYGVRIEFLSPQGQRTTTLTSKEGTYHWRTGDMEARGNVVAVTPDGRRLQTQILNYDRARHEITGPEAFVFDAPERHLEGDGFVADPEFTDVRATGARRGTVQQELTP